MRAEKQFITKEYVARLNASPYFLVVEYKGLTVGQFSELRKRLSKTGSEVHVVKNSIFRIAAKEAGVADLAGTLAGQMAVVTGQRDVSAAAKVLKTFQSEFEKPKLRFGYLNRERLETAMLMELADQKKFRIICATHSPVLIDAPETYVINLDRHINRNVIDTSQGIQGASTIQ